MDKKCILYFDDLKAKLGEAGLEESTVDELVEFSKKAVPKDFVPSEELKKVKTEFDAFKDTTKEKDELINSLKIKAESADEYQIKLDEWKEKVKEVENTYTEKLQQKTLDAKINEKISEMSDLNPKAKKAFKRLLDMENVKLDNDKLLGFDEQAEKIKEENDYMKLKNNVNTPLPGDGDGVGAEEAKINEVRKAMGLK
jgi:myosin heavy subunit